MNRTNHFLRMLSLLVALTLACATSSAQDISFITEVRALLANKQATAAIQRLDTLTPQQRKEPDMLFLRGVAFQLLATQSTGEAKQLAVQQADAAYQEALSQSTPTSTTNTPGSGDGGRAGAGAPSQPTQTSQAAAVLNNLASLHAANGDDAKARNYYEQAIASNDSRRGYYALNYARYLESRDPVQAIAMSRVAMNAAPQSTEARGYLGELLWRNRIDDMLPFARDLSEQGHSDSAAQWAIKCLQTRSRPTEERTAWLVLLARNFTKDIRFNGLNDTMQADLTALQSDPLIGRGVAQLRSALKAPPQNTQAMDWWTRQYNKIASLDSSPRDTMRELLVAKAESVMSTDKLAAEAYLSAAIELGKQGPDPDAFLRLVELYANGNAPDKLKSLMSNYEAAMFSEKASAYGRNDWPLIYRMHIALGMTYAHLKVWTSNSRFQNAIFQLDAAQQAADRLNRQAEQRNKPERIVLPPTAVAKLAEGYAATNRQELALKAKVDGATKLQKFGYARESNDVLESIAIEQLQTVTPEVRNQVQHLKSVAMQAQ